MSYNEELNAHAKYSPSGADRWSNCRHSLEYSTLKNKTSFYAAEGTAAHSLAYDILTQREPQESYEVEGHTIVVSEEMRKHIKDYTDAVEALPGDKCFEKKVFFGHCIGVDDNEAFGTADVINRHDNVLHIIDLKYGKGVKVDIGLQLLLYAAGAIKDEEFVKLSIFQPRRGGWSSVGLGRSFLDSKLESLKASLQEPFLQGPRSGNWCKWCPGKSVCEAKQNELDIYFS